MTDDTKALPADVAGLITRLTHAATTACNDDLSEAGTEKRARHIERIDAILAAKESLEAALTAPLGPEVERTKTAIALLNLYEGLDADAEYGTRLPSWLDMEHDGDCTKKPYTCSHCLADNFLAMADKLIAYVGRTPLQDLGLEVEEIEARLGAATPEIESALNVDPEIRGGRPVLRGTGFTISQLLVELADSVGPMEVGDNFNLSRSAIERVLHELAERIVFIAHAPTDIRFLIDRLRAEVAGRKDVERDARRYRRLQILGCAVMNTPELDKGLVSRFSNLDKIMDDDLKSYPSRGEARAALTKGEG